MWHKRAVVNQPRVNYFEMPFEENKQDFCESLLPFNSHPMWMKVSPEMKSVCLSYAWILYNMKTVYVECNVVTPACEDLIKNPVPSANQAVIQQVVSEALLDEALHTKMSIDACNYIYEKRKLKHLGEIRFNLVEWQKAQMALCLDERESRWTRLAIACASETLITDYLDNLSKNDEIQPICHAVTKAHAIDEWSHSSVFSTVVFDLVHSMNAAEKERFASVVRNTVEMFADTEMGAWEQVFKLIDFPDYEVILRESKKLVNVEVYKDSVEVLLSRIGLGVENV
jgi:hypothetical protein